MSTPAIGQPAGASGSGRLHGSRGTALRIPPHDLRGHRSGASAAAGAPAPCNDNGNDNGNGRTWFP
jgi:hypothetical protein